MKAHIFSLKQSCLEDWLVENKEKKFHAAQILEWIYVKGVESWDEMTNLSKSLRLRLKDAFCFSSLTLLRCQESKDGETQKFLWRMSDGALVESVLIYCEGRRTVCVSSQVGCPARCAFCASGQSGFFRNLSVSEIVEQVWKINHYLQKKNEKVTNIVFMGMGEPLENIDAVIEAIGIFNNPKLMNFSQRRITVSTVGVVEGIKRLGQEGLKVNLVLSLHAPNQHIRKKIIPYARKYFLEEIMSSMDEYFSLTKRDITYEYILISKINDQLTHARELARLLEGRQGCVNLIPYNPVFGVSLKRPSKETVFSFRKVLDDAGIVNTCRYTKGDDIAAACGQLAFQKEELPKGQ